MRIAGGLVAVSLLVGIGCSTTANDDVRVGLSDPSLLPKHEEGGEHDDDVQGEAPPARGYMSTEAHGTANDGTWPGPEDIQLLSVSDWHGQLDPVSVNNVRHGGAAALSTYFALARKENPRTLTFTAGDAIGASPALSSAFDEAPAILAMNLMGFTADTLGNHNFDRGIPGLQRSINLASFKYVSSNLTNLSQNLSGVTAPYAIFAAGDGRTKVGVIGITNEDAPSLLFPGSMGTLQVTNAIAATNDAILKAQADGAKIIVVLAHLGATGVDASGQPVGPLLDFARGVTKADVIFGDHTDFQLKTRVNGALVIENRSKGLTYARVKLKVAGSALLWSDAEILPTPSNAVTPDPAIVSMLEPYRKALAAKFDVKIGVANGRFVRASNNERLREVEIGNLVADAMRITYGTQIAFTNGGGIRASLPSSYVPKDTSLNRTTAPFDLVLGDAHTILPFGNVVVTRTMTGAQLCKALEKSVEALPGSNGRFLQISGFRYRYTLTPAPGASRIVSVALDDGTPEGTPVPCGTPQAQAMTITAALPDFVNAGGDGYLMLADGSGSTRGLMADVLADFVRARGTVTPYVDGRIAVASP